MSEDPFSFDDDDRTVLRPKGPPQSRGPSYSGTQTVPTLGGVNPLEKAASRLLPLFITIKSSSAHPNPNQLRNQLIQELNEFKENAHHILNDRKKVTQASYVMCTVLDEAAMNTPWGHQSNWAQHNLLSTFHNEVIGGERFFTLLKGLGKNPHENIEILELMYLCLSLGYEGNYRIAQNGQETLAKVRNWLYEIIGSVRSRPDTALSIQWEGSSVKESQLSKFTVLWVVAAIAFAVSSIVFVLYRFNLGSRSDLAIEQFYSIEPQELEIRSIAPPIRPLLNDEDDTTVVTLTQLLQAQIDLGLVDVTESFNEARVRILRNDVFGSGRVDLNEDLKPLISAIGSALNEFKGDINVIGHTDNIPIRSGRYPSNTELSRARAESVASELNLTIDDNARLTAEGLGPLEPIADNATPEGRAKNRRVEILLFY